MLFHPYDYATIQAAWDTYPVERVRYGEDETGWVLRLGADHVCVANVPLMDDLYQLDICPLVPADRVGALPRLGPVLQRYYHQRALVRYACLDDQEELLRPYRLFASLLRARDHAIEGIVPGAAQVQARTGRALAAHITEAAADAGLELTSVSVTTEDD
jgi:hypothetical protein